MDQACFLRNTTISPIVIENGWCAHGRRTADASRLIGDRTGWG